MSEKKLLNEAKLYYKNGRIKKSEVILKKIIQQTNNKFLISEAYYWLAQIETLQNNIPNAIKYAEEGIKYNNHPNLCFLLAELSTHKFNYQQSKKFYKESFALLLNNKTYFKEIENDITSMIIKYIQILLKIGVENQNDFIFLEDFEETLENETISLLYAQFLLSLGLSPENFYKKAVLYKKRAFLYDNLTGYYNSQHQYNKTIAAAREGLEVFPQDYILKNNYAIALWNMEEKEDAFIWLTEAKNEACEYKIAIRNLQKIEATIDKDDLYNKLQKKGYEFLNLAENYMKSGKWLNSYFALKKARICHLEIDEKKEKETIVNYLNNKKIFNGVIEIANQSYTITKELKNLKLNAANGNWNPDYLSNKSDYFFKVKKGESNQEAQQRFTETAINVMQKYDIFHFHFATSLLNNFADFPFLKNEGKKVINHFWGSDIRMLSIAKKINPYIKVKVSNETFLKKRLEKIAYFFPNAIVTDHEEYLYVKDFFHKIYIIPTMIELDNYPFSFNYNKNKKITIVHAPTHTDIKGTKKILEVIEKLKSDFDFEFILVKGKSHNEAKEIYKKADIIVDELHCGTYGLLSVETMAMGKTVLTWITPYMKEKYPKELPLISVNPDTLERELRYLLKNPEILEEKAHIGRKYVETYHDSKKNIWSIMRAYMEI